MCNYSDAFSHLKKDIVMKSLIMKIGEKITIKDRKESNLALAISLLVIEQQVSFKAAITIKKRFRKLIEKKTHNQILKIKDLELQSIGISFRKVEYIKNVYRYFLKSKFDFFKEEESLVIKELTAIKGIGNWTAEMFLIFILCKKNIFSKGDLALINSIKINYQINNLDNKKLDRIVEKWSPYKTIACLLLWKSIEENKFADFEKGNLS